MISLHELTLEKFRDGLLNKDFSALEITQAYLKHIEATDSKIGAYLSVLADSAVREAEAVDVALARGEDLGPLAGAPLAIKDNMLIEGGITTAGSKILENYRASYDATVIKKLKDAHAVFLGKTNLDEFAMGSSTEKSAFHITKNPHDPTRVPGGTSGGSAAAVAAHTALAALGSDTGGSIRQPAAFCGVVGLKPTYGAVSRSGLIAAASSFDQIGTLTKTVKDAALLFNLIRGADPLDATSIDHNYSADLTNPNLAEIKKIRIGLPQEYFAHELNPEIQAGIDLVLQKIKSLGLEVKEVSLPHTRYALACYYILIFAEESANLARFDGIRYGRTNNLKLTTNNLKDVYFNTRGEGFGAEAKRRIILGTFVLSSGYYDAYYGKAQKIRALITQDFDAAFKQVDVILAPTTPTPAFKIGEKTNDPLSMYLEDIFTVPVNLAGLPALAMPANSKEQMANGDLPVGVQLIGRPFGEADILGLGTYLEKI